MINHIEKEKKMTTAENPMQKIITRCWEDEAFKKRLIADPAKTIDAEGVRIPAGVSIRVVEDTDQVRTLIIPPAPSHLDDDQLKRITGGRDMPIPCGHSDFCPPHFNDISR
jgi:hypothetical protein